jgi:hypothetical protein
VQIIAIVKYYLNQEPPVFTLGLAARLRKEGRRLAHVGVAHPLMLIHNIARIFEERNCPEPFALNLITYRCLFHLKSTHYVIWHASSERQNAFGGEINVFGS